MHTHSEKSARTAEESARNFRERTEREREIGPARTPAGLSGLHIRAARDVVALFSTRLVLSATYPRPTLGLFLHSTLFLCPLLLRHTLLQSYLIVRVRTASDALIYCRSLRILFVAQPYTSRLRTVQRIYIYIYIIYIICYGRHTHNQKYIYKLSM